MQPDPSSIQLAERVGAHAAVVTFAGSRQLSPHVVEVALEGSAATLAGEPGNDLMVRLEDARGRAVRRRFSVRSLDRDGDRLTLWVTTDHEGPGTTWAVSTAPGTAVDVVGPRGKIPVHPGRDWHLFVGDASALGAIYRMAESVTRGPVLVVVEVDDVADVTTLAVSPDVTLSFVMVERRGRRYDDPAGILLGLAGIDLPPGVGQAYVFGEFHVVRAAVAALGDRGLTEDQISPKAFWRTERSNRDHGEPERD